MMEDAVETQAKWYARPVFFVADVNRALRFYVHVLGFEKAWHEGLSSHPQGRDPA
jgi:catechol 2,3-dioxygenase-like lactoylglutathione lyase family enzyme